MSDAAVSTRWRPADWAGFAAVCLFALLLRVPVAAMPLERDEGEYAYIAQQWLQGGLPYRDSFDQKPPGVHLMYVLIEALGGTTPAAIHWACRSTRWARSPCCFFSAGISRRRPGAWPPPPSPHL